MFSRTFVTVVLAGFVSAQLSSGCTNALTSIASNPEAAACLNPASLVPVVLASGNSSIVEPINAWLTDICGAPACSNATLAAVVTNATTGCSAELAGFGLSPDVVPSIISAVQQYYPTVRKIVCLRDGSTNCITQTLTNFESVLGPLSTANIMGAVGGSVPSIPSNITCTNCIKAAYNILTTDIPSLVSDASPAVQSECGASFVDGTTPSGISQSAVDAATPSGGTSGAISSFSSGGVLAGMGVSALVAVSSAFAFLG